MQEFVIANKEVLKHFRLTGTNSTMTMLRQVFQGMEVVYGPTMSSGPLGGDAQVAALLTRGDLGGMIFFADPLSAHPHIADIQSLIRLANVHDILYACNRTTARAMIRTLNAGLRYPSLIPSFYETLESPSVAKYREEQTALVEVLKQRQFMLENAQKEIINQISEATSETIDILYCEEELSIAITPDIFSPIEKVDMNSESFGGGHMSEDSHLTKEELDDLAGVLHSPTSLAIS